MEARGKIERRIEMQEKHIAVFVDFDNIEIGVKSTLQREFSVAVVLDALKERGHIVAKFAYANWGRQEAATRQMAENAVQMVQRIPSPRGDKNGGDINLALDALEMAFTHSHVNAFVIVSGDSDFIPLVNKLKEYGKTVFIVGGKAFTSTILQQNCHEFISYESIMGDEPPREHRRHHQREDKGGDKGSEKPEKGERPEKKEQPRRDRPAPLELSQAMPLVERALEVLERRGVQPQLGLLKSTMLQLAPAFNERAYGARSFSDFVEKIKNAEFVKVTGSGGRYVIERKSTSPASQPMLKPEGALQFVRDLLENHRLDLEEGASIAELEGWAKEEMPDFDWQKYGFQQFAELINFAQDRQVTRTEPSEEFGLMVYLGAEFYPPAPPAMPERDEASEEEDDGPQPIVRGQPSFLEPDVKPEPTTRMSAKPRKRRSGPPATKRPRRKKPQ
jgi:uncharacterized protein (TIGR00288 family)